MITSGFDGIITGYDLEKMTSPATETPAQLTRVAEVAAGRRITNEGTVVPLSSTEWTERWNELKLRRHPPRPKTRQRR